MGRERGGEMLVGGIFPNQHRHLVASHTEQLTIDCSWNHNSKEAPTTCVKSWTKKAGNLSARHFQGCSDFELESECLLEQVRNRVVVLLLDDEAGPVNFDWREMVAALADFAPSAR